MIELSTVLKQSTGQVSCNLNDEVAILNTGRVAFAGGVDRVRGDHDLPSAPRLPRRAVVQVGGHRIGLIHGTRRRTDALVVAGQRRRQGLTHRPARETRRRRA